MAIVQEMNLNMIPHSLPVIVQVDQYDTGEKRLVAHLFEGQNQYTPGAGATAVIQGTKPDKHGFSYEAEISGATVTADLTQQMSCVAGQTRCQFVVTEATGRTGTFVFILKVQASALADDTDISETELPSIIDTAEKNAERAEAAVEHYPYIDKETLHWMVWDVETGAFVDTGVIAEGSGYTPGTGIDITDGVISVTSDAEPTEGSDAPVSSGGVYTALQGKQDELTFDAVPTDGSNNPVKSNGIYDALQDKQDTLTGGVGITISNDVISVEADTAPRSGSNKPVESGGVFTELAKKQDKLIAGANIQIDPDTNEISATDTTYDPATQAAAGLMSAADKTKLDGIAAGAEVNVQADYTETDTSADSYIKHKPTLGTAAAKDAINAVTAGSTDLVESGAVKDAIDTAISAAYKPAGTKTCAELLPALLVAANKGNVYNITDDGTTTADFLEGKGHPIRTGDNVGVCEPTAGTYKFDLLSGFIDTSGFQTKLISNAVEGQATVEGALSALSSNKQPKTLSAPITVDGVQKTTVEDTLSALNTLAEANKTNKQDKNLSSTVESESTVEGALGALSSNKQPKELSIAITIDGTSETTVEGALGALNTFVETKQDALTAGTGIDITSNTISVDADATPTDGSSKPVTSNGVYDALATKQDNLSAGTGIDITSNTVSVDTDAVPTDGSTKPVESNGVFDALATKQDTLSAGTGIDITSNTVSVDADTVPTQNSAKPITSGGAYTALDAKQPKTMSAAITVDGTQETTVEGALSAINTLAAGNKTAITDIKDGQSIDSFADVESALVRKQDALGLYIDDDGYICQD